MMNIISKIAQKPSDKTIRITRILFALVLLLTIIFGWSVTRTEFGLPEYIKYILYVFPLIGLIRGIFDPGVFRKKIWKWTIFGIGVTMIVLSLFVIEDKDIIPNTPAVVENTGSLNLADLGKVDPISTPFTLPADNLF